MQYSGINIVNKDSGTTVTARDEDGVSIPVFVAADGKVYVTPGYDVDGPISLIISDNDLTYGFVQYSIPVRGHSVGRDDNGYDPYYPGYRPGYRPGGHDRDGRRGRDDDRRTGHEDEKVVDTREVHEHTAYMKGYPDGTVRPNGYIKRAEAAALVTRLLGLDTFASAMKPVFSDTPSAWYNKAINAAVERGIMKGYPDGSFRPNAPITRAEFTQMISTIDNKPYGVAPFADVKGHWAERAIGSEYQAGRIMGYPDGTFRPNAFITRCEAVVILNKIFERSYDAMSAMNCPTKGNIKFFIDLDGSFWGYYDMVEATNTHSFKRRVKGNVQEDWVEVK
ncbi:S-layer homology domain-containing protein [Fenollaria sporofastidiosus]|uniref:S-layer homology domain-containing protein n=1 Tax=Fenollaria sporofastidiosus TaxID=2811778 RepID=UPI001C00333A|nr:S-layer homology domain-containing protein [Fenollaria sporofastidiosus]